MSNPLPKDDDITTNRLLQLIKQVFDCIEQEGTGAQPHSTIISEKCMIIKFKEGEEFKVFIHQQRDLQ
jgi:hypothetical protein